MKARKLYSILRIDLSLFSMLKQKRSGMPVVFCTGMPVIQRTGMRIDQIFKQADQIECKSVKLFDSTYLVPKIIKYSAIYIRLN